MDPIAAKDVDGKPRESMEGKSKLGYLLYIERD